MAKSKTTTKKKTTTLLDEEATVPDRSRSAKKRRSTPSAVRRVPVQYTPRIPSARCPGC